MITYNTNVSQHKLVAVKAAATTQHTFIHGTTLSTFIKHSCLRLYLLYIHLSSTLLFQLRAKKLGEGSKPSRLAWRQQAQRQKRNIASPPVPAKNTRSRSRNFLGGGFVQLEKCLLTWHWCACTCVRVLYFALALHAFLIVTWCSAMAPNLPLESSI